MGAKALTSNRHCSYRSAVHELNVRLRQAGYDLHYHNGFIQIASNPIISSEVDSPFWHAVSPGQWKNVEVDILEAIDRRDTGGRDPALYAAKALESAIKIISGELSLTHGGEKGAHNYIENLASKRAGYFIDRWEAESLKGFFSSVRNPLGHGPGDEKMPELSAQQTNWAIGFCMIWSKSLIERM